MPRDSEEEPRVGVEERCLAQIYPDPKTRMKIVVHGATKKDPAQKHDHHYCCSAGKDWSGNYAVVGVKSRTRRLRKKRLMGQQWIVHKKVAARGGMVRFVLRSRR